MRFRNRLSIFMLLVGLILGRGNALACDVCGCSFNAKRSADKTAVGSTITTPTANTLGQGRGFAGFLFEHQRYNSIPAGNAHQLHEEGRDVHDKTHEQFYTFAGGYGAAPDLDVYLALPLIERASIQIEDEDRLSQSEYSFGVGDLRATGKYRFWKGTVDAALLVGIKAPTGKTSEQDRSNAKFEPELQPGSGSWDFTEGLAVSKTLSNHWAIASAIQYTYRGEGAQDEKLGDIFRHDVGVSYALKPLGQHPNMSLVLELQTQWLDKDHTRQSDKVLDSGGTTVFFSPGLSMDLSPSVVAFAAVPIPIYQNLGGEHEELKYEILTGVSWHF